LVISFPQPTLLMIGNDAALAYLIGRYAERSGYGIYTVHIAPSAAEVCALRPTAVLFPSVENLEAAQTLVADLANRDIPLLVCSSAADQARARDLGADYCLLHPLTYDNFLAVLTAASVTPAADNTNAPESDDGFQVNVT
jgi:CheY-like chemotaxis protein